MTLPTIVMTHAARAPMAHHMAQASGRTRIAIVHEDILGLTIVEEKELPQGETTLFEAEGLPFVVAHDFPLPRPGVWIDHLEASDGGAGFALDRFGPSASPLVDVEAAILAFSWSAYDELQLPGGTRVRPDEAVAPQLWNLSSEGNAPGRDTSLFLLRRLLLALPWTLRSPVSPAASLLLDLALDPAQPCRASCLELASEVLAASRSPLAADAPDVSRAIQAAFVGAAPRLVPLLDDGDDAVRLRAPMMLFLLSSRGFEPAADAIQHRFARATNELERAALILSLGHLRPGGRRIDALLPSLEDRSPLVRACAGYAVLGAAPCHRQAVATLASVLEAPGTAEQRWTQLPRSYTDGNSFSEMMGAELARHRAFAPVT